MNKKHLLLLGLCLLMSVGFPAPVHAEEVTDFENWVPDGNGGYTNSSGQTGSDGSSDVHVQDEGSGKSESNSSSFESGIIINTDTEKQTSVTINTTVTEENKNTIENVTNGNMVPVVEEERSTNEHTNSGMNNNGDSGGGKKPEGGESGDIGNPKVPNNQTPSPQPESNNVPSNNDGTDKGSNKPGPILTPGTPEQNEEGHDYGTHWGITNAESLDEVTVDENGIWTIKYHFSDGTKSELSFDSIEEFTFVLTGVKDEHGNKTRKEVRFNRSDELEEWIFKYFSWRAINLTYKTSSYYGTGKIVAKTTKSSAVFNLDEAGKYRVLATPYHDVRHYHIYEWTDEDGSHSEEVTDYWEYDRKKSPDVSCC